MMSAEALIESLHLERHPEGGWYRETWRADHEPGQRAAGTCIYFLLKSGESSRWHRVDSAEVWHYYAGAPLALSVHHEGTTTELMLGNDIASGERPQRIVPPGAWQAAHSMGEFTLVGCTVSPGFDFANFEMAPAGWAPES